MKSFLRISTKYKYRLLISYFLIVATPLIIMTGIVYNISADNMQKEIEASNAYKLNQFKLNMELRIKELKNLALIVNVDKKLTPHNLDNNEYKRLEGIDQIGLYNSQTAFINNYSLYMKSSGKVYSRAGQSSISTFLKGTHNFNESGVTVFTNMIDQLKLPAFVGQEWFEKNDVEYTDYILYMYPISYSDYNPYGVVFFEIRNCKISEMLKNITGHIKGYLLILDRNNNVILSERILSYCQQRKLICLKILT